MKCVSAFFLRPVFWGYAVWPERVTGVALFATAMVALAPCVGHVDPVGEQLDANRAGLG